LNFIEIDRGRRGKRFNDLPGQSGRRRGGGNLRCGGVDGMGLFHLARRIRVAIVKTAQQAPK